MSYLVTSQGDRLTTSAGAYLVDSDGAPVVGTGTRASIPLGALVRDFVEHHCPTCGSVSTRDGRRGWRNSPFFCNSECYGVALSTMSKKSHFARGGGVIRTSRGTIPNIGAN